MARIYGVKDAPTIDEAIVEAINYDLMQQHLGPGTHFSEKSVCDRFGVSRMNVKRALLTLSNIEVVEFQANKGARIRQPNLQQAMTLFETPGSLNPLLLKMLWFREVTLIWSLLMPMQCSKRQLLVTMTVNN